MQRWIIHIDMDAFFASVEQRDNPELAGKPVIIGGIGGRGVVSTASYEARRFGVHSAMSMAEAKQRCPKGIFLPANHKKYNNVSTEIRTIFSQFSPLVEPLSIDEAFLDVTGMEHLYSEPTLIAKLIKERIKSELNLTASAGIAANKFLAKLASDLQKPDGLVVIYPGQEQQILKNIPVERMWGVGQVNRRILKELGIRTIGQLASCDINLLVEKCGQFAYVMQKMAFGQDDRPVVPKHEPKSVGNEITYEEDLLTYSELETQLLALSEKVAWRLRSSGYSGRTITVKLRFSSFKTITRSKTLAEPTNYDDVIYQTVHEMCKKVVLSEGIRLVGVSVANLQVGSGQISLFAEENIKTAAVYQTIDNLRNRFGEGIITKGRLLGLKKH